MRRSFDFNIKFILLVITTTVFMPSLTLSARLHKEEKMRRIVRMTDFDNCKDRPIRPFHFNQHKVYLASKNEYTLLGEGQNDKSLRTIDYILVNMSKCTERSKTNCEHFRRMEWNSGAIICPLFKSNLTPWASVVKGFHPRLGCPYQQGNFTVSFTPDIGGLSQILPTGNEYWVVQFEFHDQNLSPWLCIHTESDFPRVRA